MKFLNCASFFVLSQTLSHVSALPKYAEGIDLNAPVPLNALKKGGNLAGRTTEFGGHHIPIEEWAKIVKDSIAEAGMPDARRVKKRSTFDPVAQLIDG